jgi:hypothetical protein
MNPSAFPMLKTNGFRITMAKGMIPATGTGGIEKRRGFWITEQIVTSPADVADSRSKPPALATARPSNDSLSWPMRTVPSWGISPNHCVIRKIVRNSN